MASSGRVRQSGTVSRPSWGTAQLPSYQPLANKLNDAAQRALHNLPSDHRLDGLQIRLKHANSVLSNTAGELTDRYQQKSTAHKRRQARLRAQGVEADIDSGDLQQMKRNATDVTSRIEESVRRIIDARVEVDGAESALKELDSNISAGRGTLAPTQSTLGASQYKQKRRRRGLESDDEDDEEAGDEIAPSQVLGDGPVVWWKKKIAEKRARYEGLSMRSRYASHNDYVGFRKVIHDARHPEDEAPPMPHASTWFSSMEEVPDANGDGADRQAAAGPDHDEDIAIASEKKSLKCPITLLTMVDPLSSTKCPHSFERSAILEMLQLSEMRIGGSGRRGAQDGQKAMKCPECDVILTASELQSDPVLIRRIKRLQAAEAMVEGDSDDDDAGRPSLPRGTQQRPEEPISSDNEDGPLAAARARSVIPRIKAERIKAEQLANSARARDVSVVPNSQVQGLMREDERPSSTAESEIVDLEDTMSEDDEG